MFAMPVCIQASLQPDLTFLLFFPDHLALKAATITALTAEIYFSMDDDAIIIFPGATPPTLLHNQPQFNKAPSAECKNEAVKRKRERE